MKDVLVTGAYGGMGRAACQAFKARGYRVFALDRAVEEAEESIGPIQADVTDEAQVIAAIAHVRAYTGSLYAVVHFAGIYMLDSLLEMEAEAFRRIFDVNLNGVFLVNKYALPLLHRGSRILITTSELAPLDPLPFTGVYAVTKAAQMKMVNNYAPYLAPYGVTINNVAPGAIATPRNASVVEDDALRTAVEKKIPCGRFGTVEEIAPAVLLLCSNEGAYITGTDLIIDGGLSLSV